MMQFGKAIPPFKSLLAVEAVARLRSFTQAGKELNISQSAVSHAVTLAESFLETRLFDRSARPVEMTPAGRDYAAKLAACLSQLAADAQALQRRKAKNVLTVSCNLANGTYWLLPRLTEFQDARPDIEVNMVTTLDGLAALHDGIDVAIRFGNGKWTGSEAHLLFREQIVPVAAPGYLGQADRVRRPSDLLGHRLLHARTIDASWYDWPQWFARHNVKPRGSLPGPAFDNHLLMMQAASSGRGIALGWIATATDLYLEGLLEPAYAAPLVLEEGLYAVTRNAGNPRVAAFLEWIIGTARQKFLALAAPHWNSAAML